MSLSAEASTTSIATQDDTPGDFESQKSDLKDKIVGAYNSLVQVRVSTVVADVDLTVSDENNRLDLGQFDLDNEKTIITQSDLVGGDIVTIISTGLESNAEIRQFHAEQVEAAAQVVPENLKVLVDLFQQVVSVLKS